MKLPDKLLQHRLDVEKKIRTLTGRNISVFQLMVSSIACGCVGLTFFPVGFKREDMEVFGDSLLPQLKEISEDVGIFLEAAFIQTRADDSEIAKLKLQSLCNSCKSDYKGAEGKPWPGVYILHYDKTEKLHPNEFLEYRSDIEEELRKMSKKFAHVKELGVFVLSCGCSGLVASISGINAEDIKGKDLSFFKNMSTELGVDPKVMYSTFSYGTNYVSSITSKDTCDSCKEIYKENSVSPEFILL